MCQGRMVDTRHVNNAQVKREKGAEGGREVEEVRRKRGRMIPKVTIYIYRDIFKVVLIFFFIGPGDKRVSLYVWEEAEGKEAP